MEIFLKADKATVAAVVHLMCTVLWYYFAIDQYRCDMFVSSKTRQSEIADFAPVPPAGELEHNLVFVCAALCANVT